MLREIQAASARRALAQCACALLTGCSRADSDIAHAPPDPNEIIQAEIARPRLTRGHCAGAAAIAVLDLKAFFDRWVYAAAPDL
jgi:hypothetical protein